MSLKPKAQITALPILDQFKIKESVPGFGPINKNTICNTELVKDPNNKKFAM